MGNQPLTCLKNGHKMPQLGLGTWQTTEAALENAVDVGYRLFDTAPSYKNEELIGRTIQKYIQMGTLKRAEFFITTKIWPTCLHPDRMEAHVRESLEKLQTTYVDLLLAHMPTCYELDGVTHDPSVTVEDIWRGLEDLYNKGLCKAIGVSNWSIEQMERVRKSGTVPIHVAQFECHIYLPQHELVEYCKKNTIRMTSYGSLGTPEGKIEYNGRTSDWSDCPKMTEEQLVVDLAARYKRTPAQILLRYLLDRGICIIPKTTNPEKLLENLNVVEFHLADEEVEQLNNIPKRHRFFIQDHMIGHPEDSFASER